ncbi:uncharacterized protein [Fopius arisanus]|uniref:Endonuclease/exonuclease/phosphatase domain-containing protein n=1 Tax=Fopius arisanus TaxID=64838 RepID=A0A9R1THE0_9HYME|nr:PREDICTED: uncharacterized protein LOC105270320 [Fopius arisanus]
MRVLQINLNHCEAAHGLLRQTVRDLRVDLVCILEPYHQLDSDCWATDSCQRAAFWNCGGRPIETSNKDMEWGFVRAMVAGIHVYSCYAPPRRTAEELTVFLDRLTNDARQHSPVAIAGNFNAWTVDWGSRVTNTRRQALLEAMVHIDLVLLNSGEEPTYMRGSARSIVDLTFANTIGWKASAFDHSTFAVALDGGPLNGSDATEKAVDIMERIRRACDATMLRKGPNRRRPPVYWWSEEIAALRKECNAARRRAQRTRKTQNWTTLDGKYREIRRKFAKAITRGKASAWKELTAQVEDDRWGRPYTVVIARLKYQTLPPPTCSILLNKIVRELFPSQPDFRRIDGQNEQHTIPCITMEELLEAETRVGCSKAVDLDGFPNAAIKATIKTLPDLFLDVCNRCLMEGTFPRA